MIENRLDIQYRAKNFDLEQKIAAQKETNHQLNEKREELERQIESLKHTGDSHTTEGSVSHGSRDSIWKNKAKELESHVLKLRQEIERVKEETHKVATSPAVTGTHQNAP